MTKQTKETYFPDTIILKILKIQERDAIRGIAVVLSAPATGAYPKTKKVSRHNHPAEVHPTCRCYCCCFFPQKHHRNLVCRNKQAAIIMEWKKKAKNEKKTCRGNYSSSVVRRTCQIRKLDDSEPGNQETKRNTNKIKRVGRPRTRRRNFGDCTERDSSIASVYRRLPLIKVIIAGLRFGYTRRGGNQQRQQQRQQQQQQQQPQPQQQRQQQQRQ